MLNTMKVQSLLICIILILSTRINAQIQSPFVYDQKKVSGIAMNRLELKFNNHLVKLSMGRISSPNKFPTHSNITVIKNRINNLNLLIIPTPQFKEQTVTQIPVQILDQFATIKTINSDIEALGYKTLKIEKQKMKSGHLYMWQTPSKGSATYFYLQNPVNMSLALKMGPFPASLLTDFRIEWDHAEWIIRTNHR
jgi:hypothetical protein